MIAGTLGASFVGQMALGWPWSWFRNRPHIEANPSPDNEQLVGDSSTEKISMSTDEETEDTALTSKEEYLEDALKAGKVQIFMDGKTQIFVLLNDENKLCFLPLKDKEKFIQEFDANSIKDDCCMILGGIGFSLIFSRVQAREQMAFYGCDVYGKLLKRILEAGNNLPQRERYLEDALAAGEVHIFTDEKAHAVVWVDSEGNPCFLPLKDKTEFKKFNKDLIEDFIEDDYCHVLPSQLLAHLADRDEMQQQTKFYGADVNEKFYKRIVKRKSDLDKKFSTSKSQCLMILKDDKWNAVLVAFNWNTGKLMPLINGTMGSECERAYEVKLPHAIYNKIVLLFKVIPDACMIYDWKAKAFKVVKWSVGIAAASAKDFGGRASESARDLGGRAWEGVKSLGGRAWKKAWETARNFTAVNPIAD